jgi:hypothetical protein
VSAVLSGELMTAADREHAGRLARFRHAHPDVAIGTEFGEWHAAWDGGAASRTWLGDLLDVLAAKFGPDTG